MLCAEDAPIQSAATRAVRAPTLMAQESVWRKQEGLEEKVHFDRNVAVFFAQ